MVGRESGSGALGGPGSEYIIEADRRPVGLIHWYRLSDFLEYAGEIAERSRAAGIDVLIGGRAIGLFVHRVVFAHHDMTRAVAGPDVRNRASSLAFEKAGFGWVRDADVRGELSPEHVMALDRGDAPGR